MEKDDCPNHIKTEFDGIMQQYACKENSDFSISNVDNDVESSL